MNPMMMLVLLVVCSALFALTAGVAVFFYMRYRHPEPSILEERLMGMKGRRNREEIAPEKEAIVHLTGLALIIIFAVVVTYFDVIRLIDGRSLFE